MKKIKDVSHNKSTDTVRAKYHIGDRKVSTTGLNKHKSYNHSNIAKLYDDATAQRHISDDYVSTTGSNEKMFIYHHHNSPTAFKSENISQSIDNWQSIWRYGSETFGGNINNRYISQEVGRLIEPIIVRLSEAKNRGTEAQVKELIARIADLILELNQTGYEVRNMPALSAAELDDRTFLIEWLFPNFRVGFVIDEEPKDSIWYLMTKDNLADSNSSGSLFGPKKYWVLRNLISYVAQNS